MPQISETQIHLGGTPVHWGRGGGFVANMQRLDSKAVGLAAIAVEFGTRDIKTTGIMMAWSAGALLGTRLANHYFAIGFLGIRDLKKKVINKYSLENSPTNPNDFRTAAWVLTAVNTGVTIVSGSIVALVGSKTLPYIDDMQSAFRAFGITTFGMPALIASAQAVHRWYKVAKGDWHISDKGPPPDNKKRKEEQRPLPFSPALRFVPARAGNRL